MEDHDVQIVLCPSIAVFVIETASKDDTDAFDSSFELHLGQTRNKTEVLPLLSLSGACQRP